MKAKFFVFFQMLLVLIVLTSCPGDPGNERSSEVTSVGGADTTQTSGKTVADDQVSDPKPTGNVWIKLEKDLVAVNQPAKIEYSMVPPPNSDAWVALVPSAIESQSLKDNIKHTVDRVTLPAQEHGVVELTSRNTGKYFVRLFPAQLGEVMSIAESLIEFTDKPVDGQLVLTPPYVTITGTELLEIPEQYTGRPMIAYWELEESLGDQAWIGMIPTSCEASDAKTNIDAAVDIQYLDGQTKEKSVFFLSELGEYLFRIFPSGDDEAHMLCESQVFRVIEEPEKETNNTE